ncbi:aldo/keto reductase [Deinococcus metallilatus]|uniref:Aldo/keto reductase n=1 Tax=Deinococcus metallilatus TaxID=1211322 RepID=A0AAJ5F1D8_9DEIO|nr:aldo/keto reductase [Deinococcus metallilatus]MBB5296267.1 aryl-alcohol dehydrogenase-like predicted oxidoreductase [Deinococcus metallilatus]QBY09690.1 aldo/keto reductase [Deinococcus metallilatus]RXJ08888.1 aldo/keto reductase [Deinococcus metallilatus]TLK23733.1 aldo/keto reductase [Deinococcus metallilatus]GMA14133.1 oxidoreductase [Deinococcus metallilatus]
MRPLLPPPGAPRLGLGLAALGRPGYINLGHGQDVGADKDVEVLRARAWEVLDAAWSAGLRYFDAARSYGRAEEFLGGWLKARGHEATVGSKWGYTYTADWRTDAETHEVKDHRLATLETGVLKDERVLARLAELAAEGTRVGLSTSGPKQADTLSKALAVRVDGVNPFSVVQATWNLLEPSAGEALAEAHAAGWNVVVKEAVANGRLTSRAEVAPALAHLCAEQGTTPDAVALAAALAQPWADVVLSGATTVEQLQSNLASLRLTLDLEALGDLAQPPERYWGERAGLAWT